MQAIILAGGFGTRLRSVVTDVPKPMAPIKGKPFLAYLLDDLKEQGFNHIVLSVHYLHEKIQDYFKNNYKDMMIDYAIEKEPLGTGGAIINSLINIKNNQPCFILNGDTFVTLDFSKMYSTHESTKCTMSIALRKVENCSRYGQAKVDHDMNVIEFHERGGNEAGLINTGIYLFDKKIFLEQDLPATFSFEKDFLFKRLEWIQPRAFLANDYFIDIGVPEDYARAQQEF